MVFREGCIGRGRVVSAGAGLSHGGEGNDRGMGARVVGVGRVKVRGTYIFPRIHHCL